MNAHQTELFHGLFQLHLREQGDASLQSNADGPRTVPDPHTGLPLKVATLEVGERGMCPACATPGTGGYVSFVSDLRLAFACPSCRKLVWLAGA